MAQQTAVEELYKTWLFRNLSMDDFEQAKAMEKEQIINASNKFANSLGIDKEDIEQYYNETYNK